MTSGGAFPTTTKVIDVYQSGRIAYETDGANTTLATITYAPNGTPTSVTVGSNPSTDPRYYYVYNPHGDVVALVDGGGTTVATYSYDEYGTPTIWEAFTNGWHNPYLYDGLDRVRYDSETGLYWMSVRAYDPTLGRFISHDPLGRAPLFFDASQPYVYAGNNPLNNVDPSGQWSRRNYLPDGGDWTLDPVDGSRVQTVQPGNQPCAGDRCYDGQHKCINEATCRVEQNNAANGMVMGWVIPMFLGFGIVLLAGMWRMNIDKSNLTKELQDAIDWFGEIVNGIAIVAMFAQAKGVGGWVGDVADALAHSADVALSVLRGLQAWMQMWGQWGTLVSWGWRLITTLLGAAEGPVGEIIDLGIQYFGDAALNAAEAVGWALQAKGADAMHEWSTTLGESTRTWCDTTPGACGTW